MSFIERFFLLCPLFGVSFIGGSTVYVSPPCIHTVGSVHVLLNFGEKGEKKVCSWIFLKPSNVKSLSFMRRMLFMNM